MYSHVTVPDVDEIVSEHLIKGRIVQRLLHRGSLDDTGKVRALDDMDFYQKQKRVALRNCGVIDPENIDEYIAFDGYKALYMVLSEMKPVTSSTCCWLPGVPRRRGLPTGRKWQPAMNSRRQSTCCNADEGDPGAFMTAPVLEGDPTPCWRPLMPGTPSAPTRLHYVRAEYPIAVKRLELAINQACIWPAGQEHLRHRFQLRHRTASCRRLRLRRRAALLNSIEGLRGEPGCRPPFWR